MDKNDNILDDNILDDNILLQEYSYIRTKQKTNAPDVERAWERFDREHPKVSNAYAFVRRITLYKYAAAVAVFLVLSLGGAGWWWSSGGKREVENYNIKRYILHMEQTNNGLVSAFESTRAPQQIMIGCGEQSIRHLNHSAPSKDACADTMKLETVKCAMIMNIATRTVATPRGKIYELALADGSQVVLNADSKLTFPVNFDGKSERRVKLMGEAFFKVAKDAEHPFIVETPQVSTTVLGTVFDVKSYTDSPSKVTLLSGSVKVMPTNTKSGNRETILSPGQEAIYSLGAPTIDVSSLGENASRAIKWKDGVFSFSNTPLLEAVNDIGRWYNVDVELSDNALQNTTISLEISRRVSLEDFVNSINMTQNLSAALMDGKIVICPKRASQGLKWFSLSDHL